ncbi:NAD(P)-binding protein [Neurospora intermedia]|uniref:NAD(P)-binding protein n=1 Tax=Neurospora intermedia TaxID=5142 RepID=A0ABR3DN58_NEUIN
MAPTILVAGATGNTGRSVVETLSRLLQTSEKSLPGNHQILALTRSLNGAAAQRLARLPGVQVVEQNWIEITADWLRQHNVVRAFIAPHNQPNQFAQESTFHLAALDAGVEYVVRISTTAANVRADCPAYYARSHWAIEALLGSPAFQRLHWTSLQPNVFTSFCLAPAVELVKNYRRTGKLGTPLAIMASEDAPVGIIDADDVGVLAAHLLVERDSSAHNRAKYVLNGPQDITGRQIVRMVEDLIGTKVEDVRFKDMSFVEQLVAAAPPQESRNVILSIRHAAETAWDGKCKAETTSKEVLELAAPRRTPAETFKMMLEL